MTTLKSAILTATLFLFPLFFLPTTQEYFITNKFYLLSFSSIALLLISAIELLFTKKIQIKISKNSRFKLLLLGAIFLSILISSPNKIQAFLNPNFGFIAIFSLIIFTYYLQKSTIVIFDFLSFSGLVLSAVTIFFFFQPFSALALPVELEFLKNQLFTPLGNQLDLAIFLGFLLVTAILQLFFSHHNWKRFNFPAVYHLLVFFSTLAALIITIFTLRATPLLAGESRSFMPVKYAWFGFTETLKNPLTALFGVGVDNFSYLFTRVRDVAFNLSPLWQSKSFDLASSTLLQIAIEAGLLGLTTIIYIIYSAYKNSLKGHRLLLLPLAYLTLVLIFFPPSLTVFFLLFLGLTIFEENSTTSHPQGEGEPRVNAHPEGVLNAIQNPRLAVRQAKYETNNDSGVVANVPPQNDVILASDEGARPESNIVTSFDIRISSLISILLLSFSIIGFYFLSRSYLAEYYFKRSADFLAHGQGKLLYQYQRKAVLTNPYIERFHINFSQTNLLLATTLANTLRVRESINSLPEGENEKAIIQAGQIAIIEAKNAIALNPQKSVNWENLGIISRNLINVFNGADKEAITAYEQAILLDPQNPHYRYSLGSIYYAQKDFDQAVRAFEQAVVLKPDWANAHYTLAWSLYQKQEITRAIQEMELVVRLFDPKKNTAEYDKAKEDLELMKEKTQPQPQLPPQALPEENELILPSPPVASLEPNLDLHPESTSESDNL